MTTLYKLDNKGNTRVWKIWIDENFSIPYLRIESGILNGSLIPVETPITKGLGGKSVWEQAEADMQTEINKKIKSGYVYKLEDLKPSGSTATIPKPMKAETYHPTGKNKALTLDKLGLRGKDFYIQPKLDGWRFRIHLFYDPSDGCVSVTFYSASGDIVPSFPHIEESLKASFLKYDEYWDSLEITLDGEIYNHELGFQATASACGTTKNMTPEKLALRARMQFHIFDIVDTEMSYDDRMNICKRFVDSVNVLSVTTIKLRVHERDEFTEEQLIESAFEQFLSEGYEGLMIRRCGSLYEHKRSKNLIKYKPRNDEEFLIVGFNESIETNTLGSFRLEMNDGKQFDCNLMNELGSDAMKLHIWNNQSQYLGKFVTVLFYGFMESGLPRQPYAKAIRDKKDIS